MGMGLIGNTRSSSTYYRLYPLAPINQMTQYEYLHLSCLNNLNMEQVIAQNVP
jgi:hypothetical protein